MSAGDLESWWERSDWAMGQAGLILAHATEAFLADGLDLDVAMEATNLAEAWRDLASAWAEREEVDYEDDTDPEPVIARHK